LCLAFINSHAEKACQVDAKDIKYEKVFEFHKTSRNVVCCVDCNAKFQEWQV